jgi:phosphopantetheinyl transferase
VPLLNFLTEPDHSTIAIWNAEETNNVLFGLLLQKNNLYKIPDEFKHERRISEWITVRLLLHEILLTHDEIKIDYDQKGKPHLQNIEGNISISHTGNYVCVLYHKTLKTGIDIERVTPRIEKIAFKFVNDQERKFIRDEHKLDMLYIIWGAKESLFKWYGKGNLDFRKNFNVLPFHYNQRGQLSAQFILNKDICQMTLHYHKFNELMMVYVVSENE